jgi:hypothetical protein
MKLPAHRAGLPGKVISFYIVPLDPAHPAKAGRDTFRSLASARMPCAEAQGTMAGGDRGEARRAKSGGFGAVPLGFTTDAPRGRAGSFTC